MAEHLNDNLLRRYWQRALSVTELAQLDVHLQNCAACQTQMAGRNEITVGLAALRTDLVASGSDHLTYEELAAYVDQQLAAPPRESASAHLRECQKCAAELADLRAFRLELGEAAIVPVAPAQPGLPVRLRAWWQGSGWRWPLQLTALAAACLFAAFAATLSLRREVADLRAQLATAQRDQAQLQTELLAVQTRNARTPAVMTPAVPTPELANVIAALNDGGQQITLDPEGRLNGLTLSNRAQQQLVRRALQTGKVTFSATPAPLGKRPDILLGVPATSETFVPLAPVGKVVLSKRPQLRWRPLKGAANYRVTIFNSNYEPIAQSPELTASTWTPSQALSRAQVYLWQVTATKDGQEIKAPVAPAPEARFRILDQAKADEIANARHRTPVSSLLLGLLYTEAGLFDEAERELQKLAKANPPASIAQQLLNDLRTQRRGSNQ